MPKENLFSGISENINIVPRQIPEEIREMIKQYGTIIETYKHIIEVWTSPSTFIESDSKKVYEISVDPAADQT